MNDATLHVPVMLREAIQWLEIQPDHWYLDATFGRGGHTRKILESGGKVIAMDYDNDAVEYAKEAFAQEIVSERLIVIRDNFDKVSQHSEIMNHVIDGILYDFGASSPQLDEGERGFSFQQDALLDMRMDDRLGVTAADLVNALGKRELADLLWHFAQETQSRKIAKAIVETRKDKKITTTAELADVISRAMGGARGTLHPATKAFLALRIAVNDELGNIERTLPSALDVLAEAGRLVTISFHEGEDRIVKTTMREWEESGKGRQLTKKPETASKEEIKKNPRSRSAKLRVFEKSTETEGK